MTHLSSDQISEWILGDRNDEIGQHLQTCIQCQQDIARLQDGLLAFRQSVRDWADQPAPMKVPTRPAAWKWAALVAASMGIALLPMYLDVRQAENDAKSAQDSLLLNQIHARLVRTVPQPMEQLMVLMNEGKEDSQ